MKKGGCVYLHTNASFIDHHMFGQLHKSSMAVAESKSQDQIYLYGEQHGIDKVINKGFELSFDHYHNDGMRHLFMEQPYYTAEFLNLWIAMTY